MITFLKDNECHIIWAGIRIGKKGSVVDNISEGGSCAAIDLGKGCIISEALDEHHELVNILGEGKTLIGFAIPRWDEMRDFIVNVSRTLRCRLWLGILQLLPKDWFSSREIMV